MNHQTVYFVCVNYNNSLYTEKFLESVNAQQYDTDKFNCIAVVVDNSSKKDDYAILKKYCANFTQNRLIRSEINLGYFGGLNLGLSGLELARNDYVIIGNNDLAFSNDFVDRLMNSKYAEDVLVVAPNVITADGFNQNPHCINRVTPMRKFLYDLYFTNYWIALFLTSGAKLIKKMRGGRSNPQAKTSQNIHMGIGACYVLLPAYFKHFTKLDDSVFLYGEEALLAGQVMSVNGKIYYDADLIVNHAETATLSKLPSKVTYRFAQESYPKYKKHI